MDGLWTNRNAHGDFFRNGITEHQEGVSEIYAAVAFFTDSELLRQFAENECHIRIVVRLGFPTNPKALADLLAYPNIEVRYFSDRSFHPKLFIFGDRVALVGSANLTGCALMTNQEVVVSVESKDSRFDRLSALFSEYWAQSQVLTADVLTSYKEAYAKASSASKTIKEIEREFESDIGKSVFQNIGRDGLKKSKEMVFLESYRRTYQESVSAFDSIAKVYKDKNKRRAKSESFPLTQEIDSFFSFVRDNFATKEHWNETELGWSTEKSGLLSSHIDEWLEVGREHFDNTICNINYPLISDVLGSESSIERASYDEIMQALVVLHSFHDRLRFYSGGLTALVDAFKNANNVMNVKSSLKHLLYGKGDVVRRMADLIYDERYKLPQFGKSNVQELVGWINKDGLPVINGRTTKVLRYYGFNVLQL